MRDRFTTTTLFRVILSVFFLLCFLVNSSVASNELVFSAEEQAWLAAHPIIRIAPDPDFPPIEFIDKDGNYRGIAADFIHLLEKKLPLKIEIVALKNWNEVVKQAKTRQIDMFGAAAPTPE